MAAVVFAESYSGLEDVLTEKDLFDLRDTVATSRLRSCVSNDARSSVQSVVIIPSAVDYISFSFDFIKDKISRFSLLTAATLQILSDNRLDRYLKISVEGGRASLADFLLPTWR